MTDTDTLELTCQVCGNVGLEDGSDGYFYCQRCGSQADDIRDTGEDADDFVDVGGNPSAYMASRRRRRTNTTDPVSQSQPERSQFWESLKTEQDDAADGVGPTGPSDFGSGTQPLTYDDYHSKIRLRYVMGVQVLIQLQCKALVEKFDVNDMVVGVAGTIWLRFVALSRVFNDDWADEAITQSESQTQGPVDGFVSSGKHRAEPHNILGQRAVMIWFRSLSKTIPLSYSLVISFLACHVLREAILPTDILKWTLEGKLPYFAAFVEIEKEIDPPPRGCPISSSRMFRPTQAVSLQKLESLAASVAEIVGLELPPVNFFAIASRYLRLLSFPMEKIIPHACRIYEWSMPPECWLSANELRLPTRVCVMSTLIVSIRILYNIHGFGKWEMSFSGSSGSSSSLADRNIEVEPKCNTDTNDDAKQQSTPPDIDAKELLLTLDAKYGELVEMFEYSKDLPSYLQYCKDVVFAGVEPSFEDIEESKIIEEFWDFYQKQQGLKSSNDCEIGSLGRNSGDNKRSREDIRNTPKESKKLRDDGFISNNPLEQSGFSHGNKFWQSSIDQGNSPRKVESGESDKDRAIRRLKSNMEENRFCYIPPRVNPKRFDYLHYARKKDEGAYSYAVHADYYILLRSCAKLAQVDIRSMHAGVLSFERRLAWLEKRIDHCLQVKLPTDTCEFCHSDEVEENVADDSMGFSKLNL